MRRLALFDLDNTLVDLHEAFLVWVEEFAREHGLGHDGVSWLVDLDRSGAPHREVFFTGQKITSDSSTRLTNSGAGTAGACRTSSAAAPRS